MAVKRFHIAKPEQLRELAEFVKKGKLGPMISVWTTTVRKQGYSCWDNAIYIGFSGDRNRVAEIYRVSAGNELVYCATMQYNKALNWCEKHLREVFVG